MRYTHYQFMKDYPDEDTCLDAVFTERYGDVKQCPNPNCFKDTKFYRVTGRKCYACMHCGYQLHPLAETIFHKSSTPLTKWFYAMYLFSVSKNGVSAKELERHLGVTYKTAFRMAQMIRKLMTDTGTIGGPGKTVEADETYYGKKAKTRLELQTNKSAVLGVIERGGQMRVKVVDKTNRESISRFFFESLKSGGTLYTDESPAYTWAKSLMEHESVNHHKDEYARGKVSTNTIEGFWGQVKRSISGTYHFVSPKYLHLYVSEFAFRYSYRDVAVYPVLLERASKHV